MRDAAVETGGGWAMRQFVRFEDLVTEAELPAEGTEGRDRFVEVLTSGEGRCLRCRLEAAVPDVARALSQVNASIVALAEMVHVLAERGPE